MAAEITKSALAQQQFRLFKKKVFLFFDTFRWFSRPHIHSEPVLPQPPTLYQQPGQNEKFWSWPTWLPQIVASLGSAVLKSWTHHCIFWSRWFCSQKLLLVEALTSRIVCQLASNQKLAEAGRGLFGSRGSGSSWTGEQIFGDCRSLFRSTWGMKLLMK